MKLKYLLILILPLKLYGIHSGVKANSISDFETSVVRINIKDEATSKQGACTGTVIDDGIILTAAHCFEFFQSNNLVYSVLFRSNGGGFFEVKAKDFRLNSEADLALIKLSEGTPSGYKNIEIAKKDQLEELLKSPTQITSAGYGLIGDNEFPLELWATPPQDTKVFFLADKIIAMKSDLSSVCPGDSGGPTLIQSQIDQKWLLFGVNQRGICIPGKLYFSGRIDFFADWILQSIKSMNFSPDK